MEEISILGVFPGIFTFGNMLCGFLSIVQSAEGEITHAAWFIILGAFLDGLDGMVARLSRSYSKLGSELDSLADFLTFGIAPAFIIYQIKPEIFERFGWILPIIYIASGGYRLARYNVIVPIEEKGFFIGLPITVSGAFIASFVLFSHKVWGTVPLRTYMLSVVVLLSFLMVSRIRYEHFVRYFLFRRNPSRTHLLVAILSFALILYNIYIFLFPLICLYILYGVGCLFLRKPEKESKGTNDLQVQG